MIDRAPPSGARNAAQANFAIGEFCNWRILQLECGRSKLCLEVLRLRPWARPAVRLTAPAMEYFRKNADVRILSQHDTGEAPDVLGLLWRLRARRLRRHDVQFR